MGVERVFESGVKEIVGVCPWATVEERVGLGHKDADMWSDVYAIDDKFFTDKRIEEGEIEFRGFDDVVDVEGVGFACFWSADVGQHAVAGIKHCVVLSDDNVLHLLGHIVDATILEEAVAFFLGDIILDFHLVELVENLVDGVVDADIEEVVAHFCRTPSLRNLDENQADGSKSEKCGK